MTDREKLTKLVEESFADQHNRRRMIVVPDTVNHLLANGVVVREKGEWERRKVAFHVGCPSCGCYVRDSAEVFLDDGNLNFCPHCGSDMRGAVSDGNL